MSRCRHTGAVRRATAVWLGEHTLTAAQTRDYPVAVCAAVVTWRQISVGSCDVREVGQRGACASRHGERNSV